MKKTLSQSLALLGLWAVPALAADLEAGKLKASTVCLACHGANGVSVAAHIPHLAAQRSFYLASQLEAFKDGSRKSDVMNAMAAQLSPEDIANVAAYFESQPGPAAGARSAFLASVSQTKVSLPAGFPAGHTAYLTRDFPEDKLIKVYYANDAAVAAAAAGKPLPDGSGIFIELYAAKLGADKKPVLANGGALVRDRLLAYVTMAREAGWGQDIPEMLRNENWNYATFAPDRTLRANVNYAECFACHKPKANSSFVFLHQELIGAAAARKK